MSDNLSIRATMLGAAACAALAAGLVGQFALAGPAGAVTASKVELKNGQLRVEGQAQSATFVTVESTVSAAGARSDQNGLFKVQANSFSAPDCKITISDGATPTATVAIPGCTPSIKPVPSDPAPPSGSCAITAVPTARLTAGTNSVVNFHTTGCDTTTHSGATPTPVRWSIAAGVIPTGMSGPNFQGTTDGNLIGTPSIRGTYQFTLQVADQVGATDQENVTVIVG